MESQSYWPLVNIPVMFLRASDDFHATFDDVYVSMARLPHTNWRVSQNMHYSHSLGAEQWVWINQWFDKYLKGESITIPKTAESSLTLKPEESEAVLTVKPDQSDRIAAVDIDFSHDPNPQARFWNLATNVQKKEGVWTETLPLRPNLPLFVFANCTYPLDQKRESFGGETLTFTITSAEQNHQPTDGSWNA